MSKREWDSAEELEAAARAVAKAGAADRRTSFFVGAVLQPFSVVHFLEDALKEPAERVEELLAEFVSERYVDYFERRRHGLRRDIGPTHILQSQGYKRGQRWRGVPLGKTAWDVCIYQQLLQELRPKTVIELGTGLGGSALFFLDQCRTFGLDATVVTLDVNKKDIDKQLFREKEIEFVEGDVADIARLLPRRRLRELPHPWLVIEDSHMEIPRILKHLEPEMAVGDYLVVEDVPNAAKSSHELREGLLALPSGTFVVDTFYTDMFGRNATCSPDAIFKKVGGTTPKAPAKKSASGRSTNRR